jgi:hypothetical protein
MGRLRIRTERGGRFNVREVASDLILSDSSRRRFIDEELRSKIKRKLAADIARFLRTKKQQFSKIKPMRSRKYDFEGDDRHLLEEET